MVQNHGDGTRDRLATGRRSRHGDVQVGVDSSAPDTVKGRSLETRTRRRETDRTVTLHGKPRRGAGKVGPREQSPGLVETTTMQTMPMQIGSSSNDERTRGKGHRIVLRYETTRWSVREGQGDPKAMAERAEANEPMLHRSVSFAPRWT